MMRSSVAYGRARSTGKLHFVMGSREQNKRRIPGLAWRVCLDKLKFALSRDHQSMR